MADATTTPGGLAKDAAGNLADMPRDMAHSISHDLFDVLTLLRSTMHEVEAIGTERDADPHGLTSADSRAASLLCMAGDKVRGMLASISPYV
jgi:hypothetical protein